MTTIIEVGTTVIELTSTSLEVSPIAVVPGGSGGSGLPSGGATAEALIKDSGASGDATWQQVDTPSIADLAVTEQKVDSTIQRTVQGNIMERRPDVNYALASVLYAFAPMNIAFIGDSHGELNAWGTFVNWMQRTYGITATLGSGGQWMGVTNIFGIRTNSGAVLNSTAGPGGYLAELDTTDWIEFDPVDHVDRFEVWGVGAVAVDLYIGGVFSSTLATVTLSAGVPWVSSVMNRGDYSIRVRATADGVDVWGAFAAAGNGSSGPRFWSFSHSGWNWTHFDPDTHSETWEMVDALNPAAVILGIATNCATAADYRDGTIEAITRARDLNAERTIVLWFPHLSSASGDDEDWWDDAHQYFRDICRDYNCIPADMYKVTGDLSTDDPHALSDDNVHLNSMGRIVASWLMYKALEGVPPKYRFADAEGGSMVEVLKFRSRDGISTEHVSLYAGAYFGDLYQLAVTSPDFSTWVPVAAGTPTHSQHLVTRKWTERVSGSRPTAKSRDNIFWIPQHTSRTTTAMVLNRTYIAMDLVRRAITIDRIGVYLTVAAGAGGVIRFGVWEMAAADDEWPKALVADLGTVDATVGGNTYIDLGSPLTLPGGYWYAFGAVHQGGASDPTARSTATGYPTPPCAPVNVTSSSYISGASYDGDSGALSADIEGKSFSSAASVPLIYVRHD